jgi:hypothetical protein
LGETVVALGGLQEAKDALLAAWGIAGNPPPATAVPGEMRQPVSTDSELSNEMLQELETDVLVLCTETQDIGFDPSFKLRVGRLLKKRGVNTARDLLIMGRNNLEGLYGMGSTKAQVVEEEMKRHFPDMKWPKRALPELAARVCPTLRDVPWFVAPTPLIVSLYNDRGETASLHDILHGPREALRFYPQEPTRTKIDNYKYEQLRTLARAYADKFEAAKRRQSGQ